MKKKLLKATGMLLMMMVVGSAWGQSYLGLDGGFEGTAAIDNVTINTLPQAEKWTKTNANQTIADETTYVRSGDHSLRINNSSGTGRKVYSPLMTVPNQTTGVTIQYFRYVTDATDSQSNQEGVIRDATERLQGTYDTPTAGVWDLQQYSPTSLTFTSIAGIIVHKMIGTTGGNMYIDDMCIYAGGVDNTNPDPPTNCAVDTPTTTSLTIGWLAPGSGVDDGGYLVVRGITDPNTAPNAKAIYAISNTVAIGMTVVYQGTASSFVDAGLASGVTYYYRIYTYDKAYNYSTALTGNGITSSITTWTGTSDNDWTSASNWTNGLPNADVDVTIPAGASNYPTITAAATCNNITIENDATLLGENNLTVNGTTTVQKSITGYTGATDGWSVISAPVSGMAMAGSDFVPVTGEDDFYAYDQAENLWRNYLDGTNDPSWFDNFDVKTGYLVAYAPANAGTKNFVGALNSDASYVANLSNTNTSWNLIGNPYPSNITWAGVTLATASSPKVLNNSTGSWDDIGPILSTGQGVFVFAEGGSSSVTFELGDQTHTPPAKKAEAVDQIKFITDFGGKSVSLALVVNEAASQSYEWQYDSRYLYPLTTIPYLCAITEDNVWVSKYAFGSQSLESTVIPLYFKVSEEQQITFGLESFTKEIGIKKITLEDKVANKLTDLSAGDVYLYTANPNDETDRFVLHVETVTSIDETTHPESVQIYSYDNRIYLHSELNAYADVTIYNMLGQNVYHTPVELNGLQSFSLNLNKGWYVVQVITKQGVKSKKVFIN